MHRCDREPCPDDLFAHPDLEIASQTGIFVDVLLPTADVGSRGTFPHTGAGRGPLPGAERDSRWLWPSGSWIWRRLASGRSARGRTRGAQRVRDGAPNMLSPVEDGDPSRRADLSAHSFTPTLC